MEKLQKKSSRIWVLSKINVRNKRNKGLDPNRPRASIPWRAIIEVWLKWGRPFQRKGKNSRKKNCLGKPTREHLGLRLWFSEHSIDEKEFLPLCVNTLICFIDSFEINLFTSSFLVIASLTHFLVIKIHWAL